MTGIEIGFVVLVVAAFTLFMLTLAFTVWWSEKRPEPAKSAAGPRPSPSSRQDNELGAALGAASHGRRRPY